MAQQLLLLFLLSILAARCSGQESPCENISLGSCTMVEDNIINIFSAYPDKCSNLCKINHSCEFWRAQWDGSLCFLFYGDYQHSCTSFAGPINWVDCNEGPDSCYAYVEDDCVYTGERIESDEPSPGDIWSSEECRQWAELWTNDGVEFFHYNSTSEECRLYRTLLAECQAVGGPKEAPSFDQCAATTTESTTATTTESTTATPTASTTITTTATATTTPNPTKSNGILVLGGYNSAARQSVEFWSTADQGEGSCTMNNYPREMRSGPTVNLVSDRLVNCEGATCEVYRNGSWQHLQNTLRRRCYHSSATTDDAVLLIGGSWSEETTEWIPVDGSPAHPGPYYIRHGYNHCTIQVNALTIVVTGGQSSTPQDYVTEYQLNDVTETPLTPLLKPRAQHACGSFLNDNGQQVLLVTGG